MNISELKLNPKNPRVIKDEKFRQLCQSIEQFPEMMEKRPMVCVTDPVDGRLFPLGGNMRLKALQHLKMKDLPDAWVSLADDWTQEKRLEFTIKDNVSFGEWDFDELSADWDTDMLAEWGVEMPEGEDDKKPNEIGDIEFSEELLLEHNYIVLYFDNPLDWEVALETYGLKQVKDLIPRKGQPTGIGRVVNGKNYI